MFAEQAQKMVETMAEAFEVTFKRTEEMREQRQVWEVHFTWAVSVRDLLHQNDEKKAKKKSQVHSANWDEPYSHVYIF